MARPFQPCVAGDMISQDSCPLNSFIIRIRPTLVEAVNYEHEAKALPETGGYECKAVLYNLAIVMLHPLSDFLILPVILHDVQNHSCGLLFLAIYWVRSLEPIYTAP